MNPKFAAKAYASGAAVGLAQPVESFVTNLCIWLGGDEAWCRPLGTVVAIGVGFVLAYIAPQQTQLVTMEPVVAVQGK